MEGSFRPTVLEFPRLKPFDQRCHLWAQVRRAKGNQLDVTGGRVVRSPLRDAIANIGARTVRTELDLRLLDRLKAKGAGAVSLLCEAKRRRDQVHHLPTDTEWEHVSCEFIHCRFGPLSAHSGGVGFKGQTGPLEFAGEIELNARLCEECLDQVAWQARDDPCARNQFLTLVVVEENAGCLEVSRADLATLPLLPTGGGRESDETGRLKLLSELCHRPHGLHGQYIVHNQVCAAPVFSKLEGVRRIEIQDCRDILRQGQGVAAPVCGQYSKLHAVHVPAG